MATKLKNLKVDSVDLVDQGANQDAYIRLFKRHEPEGDPSETSEIGKEKQTDNTSDDPETGMFKRFVQWLGQILKSESAQENKLNVEEVIDTMKIDKSKMTPEDAKAFEELEKKYGKEDEPEDVNKNDNGGVSADTAGSSAPADTSGDSGQNTIDGAANPGNSDPVGKGGENIHPDVKKALTDYKEMVSKQNTEIEGLRKSLEIKDLENIAKKYEILGKKSDELAAKLYELKKANSTFYNDYIAVLDEQLATVEKSGLFAELGSNRQGITGADQSINIKASELRKAATGSLSDADSIVKAWEENPELAAEYEKNYRR